MKASDIKVGDTVDGWTVTDVAEVCGIVESSIELETFRQVERSADPWNTIVFVKLERGIPDPATRRTWYRADEEVECGLTKR